MSIVEPRIDKLLDKTEEDKYLLCALSSKRSRDINDMMRGQRQNRLMAAMVESTRHMTIAGIVRVFDSLKAALPRHGGDRPRRGLVRQGGVRGRRGLASKGGTLFVRAHLPGPLP